MFHEHLAYSEQKCVLSSRNVHFSWISLHFGILAGILLVIAGLRLNCLYLVVFSFESQVCKINGHFSGQGLVLWAFACNGLGTEDYGLKSHCPGSLVRKC